jgi:GDSL-like Lipase/Acylhydrolase family
MVPVDSTASFWIMSKFASIIALLLFALSARAAWPLISDAQSWTGRCYIEIVGDSIVAGGGGSGAGATYFPAQISNAIVTASGVTGIKVFNHSIGGTRWYQWNAQATNALTNSPRWLLAHWGRNDLINYPECFTNSLQVYPCAWPQIVTNINALAATCAAANVKLLIGEILPAYTNFAPVPPGNEFSVTGIRGMNDAYENWCVTNVHSSITRFVRQHDQFAVVNPYTSALDWLNPTYQQSVADQLHVSNAAYDFWGPYLVAFMGQHYSGLPYARGGVPVNITTNR